MLAGAFTVALALAPLSGAAAQAGLAAAPQGVVLDRVTVIDVEHGMRLRDQRVVVVGNRIRALGSWQRVPVPRGVRVVNARGKYLIPGLWDMHIHPSVWAPTKEAAYNQVHAVYNQLIADGITGIREPGSTIALDTYRVWKREIAAGQRVGPRLIVSGPSIEERSREQLRKCQEAPHLPECDNESDPRIFISDPEEAPRLVDSIKAAGADMIKIHIVSRPMWFAVAAEARRVGIPFGGHFDRPLASADTLDGLVASDSGARILDHEMYSPTICGRSDLDQVMSLTRCTAAAARLRRNHTWIAGWDIGGGPAWGSTAETLFHRAMRYEGPVSNVDTWRPLTTAERRQLPTGADFAAILPDSATRSWGCQRALLAYAADLPLMPGLDWPLGGMGGAVHTTLLEPVLCGVPPLWALRAATLEPARALNLADSLGTVAVGKVADLVLLEGDPLEDIWNVSKIAGVLANGRYYDRAALDRLLMEAATEWRKVKAIGRQKREKSAANQAVSP